MVELLKPFAAKPCTMYRSLAVPIAATAAPDIVIDAAARRVSDAPIEISVTAGVPGSATAVVTVAALSMPHVLEIVSIAPTGMSSRCLFVFNFPAASSVAQPAQTWQAGHGSRDGAEDLEA